VLVAAWHQGALAAQAVALAPGRFAAVVLIGAHRPAHPSTHPSEYPSGGPAAVPPAVSQQGPLPAGFRVPADVGVAVVLPTTAGPHARPSTGPSTGPSAGPSAGSVGPGSSGSEPVRARGPEVLTCRAGGEWPPAVVWAVRQAPPVLAPPVVLPPLVTPAPSASAGATQSGRTPMGEALPSRVTLNETPAGRGLPGPTVAGPQIPPAGRSSAAGRS
jgi:hypothetical protein